MNGESIFDVIIQGYSSLTRSETRVADYILKHKPELPYIMSKTLADACQVSEATITRFCRSVGCASFNDFKVRAAQAISSDSTSGPASGYDLYGDIQLEDSLEQKCQKLYRVGTQALQQTLDLLDYGAVRKVVDCLYEADNVYCFGQGNTSIIAMDAWGRFSSITSKFHWINDFHMQAITAATLGAKDVILYFSFSGAMRELSELGSLVQKTEAKLILVTRFPNSPGAKFSDLLLICGADEAPNQQGSVAVKLGQLFIIDVLFHEYCSKDAKTALENRERTLNATAPMLL